MKRYSDAFGLAFISSVNILITSRVVEHFRGRHKQLKFSDADTELGAYGIANMVAGVFAAPMSVGIPARSLANVRCGGVTRMSNLFHAAFILAFIVLGANYISRIPIPALAGVTAYVGICLLEWSTWRRLARMRKVDALAFLSTAAAVLMVNAVCCRHWLLVLSPALRLSASDQAYSRRLRTHPPNESKIVTSLSRVHGSLKDEQ